jgi:hypothetical protein
MESLEPPYFEILTPLGVRIRTTASHWARIITDKHPIMAGKDELVKQTLRQPLEIRRSRSDSGVYLHYKSESPYFICVVVRHLNGEGFIITTYRTDKIKRGELIWKP